MNRESAERIARAVYDIAHAGGRPEALAVELLNAFGELPNSIEMREVECGFPPGMWDRIPKGRAIRFNETIGDYIYGPPLGTVVYGSGPKGEVTASDMCNKMTELNKDIDKVIKMFPHIIAITGWISVKDRLPEEKINILVSGLDYGKGPGRHYLVAMRDKFNVFLLCDGNNGHCEELEHITHWMPLPEPPVASSETEVGHEKA